MDYSPFLKERQDSLIKNIQSISSYKIKATEEPVRQEWPDQISFISGIFSYKPLRQRRCISLKLPQHFSQRDCLTKALAIICFQSFNIRVMVVVWARPLQRQNRNLYSSIHFKDAFMKCLMTLLQKA